MDVRLTKADYMAIGRNDANFLLNKGAQYYREEKYSLAIEYYRLAAAMGNKQSYANLGYCYMYARSVPKNMSLALAYFKLAAQADNLDALYKLGSIYLYGTAGIPQDVETGLYYYQTAIKLFFKDYDYDIKDYPNLFFAVGKEHLPGGQLICDLQTAYNFLTYAQEGFAQEIANGITYHHKELSQVEELLQADYFAPLRAEEEADEE